MRTPQQAAIYARISDDREGRGLGVARQEAQCRARADQLGWRVGPVYSDNDLSAYRGRRRPGYEALLAATARGEGRPRRLAQRPPAQTAP